MIDCHVTQSLKMAGERDAISIPVNFHVEQPDRPPLHRENVRRMEAAKALGVKILKAPPRTAAFKLEDPTGEYFVSDAERGDLSAWIDRIHKAAAAIESHGVGFAQIKALSRQLGVNGSQELWVKALDSAKTDHERAAVLRSFREWADGDSIASHIAYGVDVFCTRDKGKGHLGPSILDPDNRRWLTADYNVRFMTIEELAAALPHGA